MPRCPLMVKRLKKVAMKDLNMQVKVKESFGEKIGWWIILISIIIPGMIVTGFMPDMNILPSYGWTAVAIAGAAMGCVISTKKNSFRSSVQWFSGGRCYFRTFHLYGYSSIFNRHYHLQKYETSYWGLDWSYSRSFVLSVFCS